MAIDVFISCSARDRDIAESLSRSLRDSGVSCWSPVEVEAGQPIKAPGTFRMVVLIFSARANKSKRVNSEIQYAIGRDMPIVALSVEDVPPRRPFDRLSRTKYWLQGRRTSLPAHIERLVYWVTMLLARLDMGSEARTLTPDRSPAAPELDAAQGPDPNDSGVQTATRSGHG